MHQGVCFRLARSCRLSILVASLFKGTHSTLDLLHRAAETLNRRIFVLGGRSRSHPGGRWRRKGGRWRSGGRISRGGDWAGGFPGKLTGQSGGDDLSGLSIDFPGMIARGSACELAEDTGRKLMLDFEQENPRSCAHSSTPPLLLGFVLVNVLVSWKTPLAPAEVYQCCS